MQVSSTRQLVLVVDDEDVSRRLVSRLADRGGYDIVEAVSGEAALAELARVRPDVILLDVMMPGLGGLETLARIRAHEVWHSYPVVMVTGHGDARALERAIQIGIHDWIVKPPAAAELRQRLARLTLRLAETEVRAILERLRLPDTNAGELATGGRRRPGIAYSVDYAGAPLRVVIPRDTSPAQLAKADVDLLERDVSIDVRGRTLWHRLWPRVSA